jgi:GT2 family glycosyltransferase
VLTLITPTRDRPEAFALLERWIAAQTYSEPFHWIVVNDSPDGDEQYRYTRNQRVIVRKPVPRERHSLCENLKTALENLPESTTEIAIVEDDDFYMPRYLDTVVGLLVRHELAGIAPAAYYNVRSRRYRTHRNHSHASLAQTAFRPSVVPELIDICRQGNPFIDLRIWRQTTKSKYLLTQAGLHVGIKGMPGARGIGSGHVLDMGTADRHLAIFRSWQIPDDYLQYHMPENSPSSESVLTEIDAPLSPYIQRPDLSIGMVVLDQPSCTKEAIRSLFNTTAHLRREILIWDNGSAAPARELLRAFATEYPDVMRVFRSEHNVGYLKPMNALAKQSSGAYFAAANNDIIVKPGWFEALRRPFGDDPLIAQVGPNMGACRLTAHMSGITVPDLMKPDYINGHLFLVPRWVIERFGLYDGENLDFAYCEDADLSLRLQEAGYKITIAPDADVEHARSKTRTSSWALMERCWRAETRNQSYMRTRWSSFLSSHHRDRHRVLITRMGQNGDLLAMESAIRGLRNRFPESEITLETECGAVMEGCPYLDHVVRRRHNCIYHEHFDYSYAFENDLEKLRPQRMCEIAGVPYTRPRYWLLGHAVEATEKYAGCGEIAVLQWQSGWESRRWDQDKWRELARRLAARFHVVEFGGAGEPLDLGDPVWDRPWSEAAAIISRAKVFVGSDSVGMHLALGLDVPAVVLFGPTTGPLISDSPFLVPVTAPNVPCLGCHHAGPYPKYGTVCPKPQLLCQIGITVDAVHAAVVAAADNPLLQGPERRPCQIVSC